MQPRPLPLVMAAGALLWFSCRSATSPDCDFGDREASAAATLARRDDRHTDGVRLYGAHCAACHGDEGRGDGPASPFLFPAARDFTRGEFRLVGTASGAPSDEDLVRTLRRGIPGTAMPGWSWMDAAELELLVDYVRALASEGMARELMSEGRTESQARTAAEVRLSPGRELPRVASIEPKLEVLDRGRELFAGQCTACHGDDGAGRREPRFDEDGSLNWARDFTAGYLKGGREAHELGWRIQAGIPGSAMPATSLTTSDLEALVAYVRHLVPEDSGADAQERRTVVAHRSERVLASTHDEEFWSLLDETCIVLSPLHASRHGEGVRRAWISAAHDGQWMAIRLRWEDATGDRRIYSDLASPDGCALQFTNQEAPRFFGMGSSSYPTNIWHWKALRLSEVAGGLDALERVPHVFAETFRGEVVTDVPLYRPSVSVAAVSEKVESMGASGVGKLDVVRDANTVEAAPVWRDGEWSIVFTRSLAAPARGDVEFVPGESVFVALAIWDASVGDRGARKSVSIWQAFELAP